MPTIYHLVALAAQKNTRLILSGDTRQHGAVAASDALVLFEKEGHMPSIELTAIRRQDPRLAKTLQERQDISLYRSAVHVASRGSPRQSFAILERLGWIREHTPKEGRALIAQHYLAASENRERVLVVAQTWDEVHTVNSSVRAVLRDSGRLGPGAEFKTYHAVDLTAAQKKDAGSYLIVHGRVRVLSSPCPA